MDLSNLKPAKGATKKKRRLGRGAGSGTGGHSSTRGTKGQKSRSGSGTLPAWFEGGQMPIYRRLPKYGFRNPFREENHIVNLSRIAKLINEGKLNPDEPITPEILEDVGAIRKAIRVKVLGGGEIEVGIDISAHSFSESAKKKIESAGGSAKIID